MCHSEFLHTDQAFFQLQIGPVEHCIVWSVSLWDGNIGLVFLWLCIYIYRYALSHTLYLTCLQAEKARIFEEDLLNAVTKAISDGCNCSFPVEFIRTGQYTCWSAPTEVTYRSTIVGTETHNSSQLIGFIDEWVNTRTTVKIEWLLHKVYPDCPVQISSLSEPECMSSEPLTGDPTLITTDPQVIQCVNACLIKLRGGGGCT